MLETPISTARPQCRAEYRAMPGPMFSGTWRVEVRERWYSPRRGGDDCSAWSFMQACDTEQEARTLAALFKSGAA